jgi:hypothetical protein
VASGARPVYEEAGPYTYRRSSRKFDVAFSEDGDLVTYRELTYVIP